MPSYKVHLVGGAATYAAVTAIASLAPIASQPKQFQLLLLGCALTGSIFPDIDIASRIQIIFFRIMLVVLPLLLFFQYYTSFICMALLSISLVIIKHRTLTHRVWFLLLITIAGVSTACTKHPSFTTLATLAGTHFFIGSVSHLILDIVVHKWKLRKYW